MSEPTRPIDRLLAIMARLRDPERGCPWDIEQNFATIAPYTIEEAYEVADAIERGDTAALKDELGDLLLQVAFHARMAEQAGLFGFDDVAAGIADKMSSPISSSNLSITESASGQSKPIRAARREILAARSKAGRARATPSRTLAASPLAALSAAL